MLRIIKSENSEHSAELSDKGILVLKLLGIAISNSPEQIKNLLENYKITVSDESTDKELIDKMLFAIQQNKRSFNYDLSEILANQLSGQGHDSFRGQEPDLIDPDSQEYTYVAAIAGAVGGIADLFGNAQQQKIAKEQAKTQTMSTILSYKAAQEKSVDESKKRAHVRAVVLSVGILSLAALFGLYLFKQKGAE